MKQNDIVQFFREEISRTDLLVHLTIPLILGLVYLSPVGFHDLKFTPGKSDIIYSYLSIFGHRDVGHLFGNIAGFLLASLISLSLFSSLGKKRLYYGIFSCILLLVPIAAGYQLLIFLEENAPGAIGLYSGAGFSTVGASFVALLAASISIQHGEIIETRIPNIFLIVGLFSMGLVYPLFVYGGVTLLLAIFGGISLLYLVLLTWGASDPDEADPSNPPFLVSLFGLFIYLVMIPNLFPIEPGDVGVHAHLIGLVYGFMIICMAWAISWWRTSLTP